MIKRIKNIFILSMAFMLAFVMTVPAQAADTVNQNEEEILEQLTEAFDNMTDEELNAYINSVANASMTMGITVSQSSVKGAWLAAAAIAKNNGYPCAAELVVRSVNNQSFTEINGGSFGKKIKTVSAYKTYHNNAVASKKSSYSGSFAITKSMNSDLFYALHKVSISTKGDLVGTSIATYTHTVTDVFDFAYDNNYDSLFTTLVNNWAWLCQQTGVLNKINVKITFIV